VIWSVPTPGLDTQEAAQALTGLAKPPPAGSGSTPAAETPDEKQAGHDVVPASTSTAGGGLEQERSPFAKQYGRRASRLSSEFLTGEITSGGGIGGAARAGEREGSGESLNEVFSPTPQDDVSSSRPSASRRKSPGGQARGKRKKVVEEEEQEDDEEVPASLEEDLDLGGSQQKKAKPKSRQPKPKAKTEAPSSKPDKTPRRVKTTAPKSQAEAKGSPPPQEKVPSDDEDAMDVSDADTSKSTSVKKAGGGKKPRGPRKETARGGSAPEASSPSMWICSQCTLENRARRAKCHACDTPRDGDVKPAVQEPSQPKPAAKKTRQPPPPADDAEPPPPKKRGRPPKSAPEGEDSVAESASTAAPRGGKARKAPPKGGDESAKAQKKKSGGRGARAGNKENSPSPNRKGAASGEEAPLAVSGRAQAGAEAEAEAPAPAASSSVQAERDDEKMEVEPGGMVIAFSGMDEDERDGHIRLVKKVMHAAAKDGDDRGVKILKSGDPSQPFTHLVVPTDKDTRRTLKVLFAVARGAWVVDAKWLSDSATAGVWEDEQAYCIER
jgi:hypothetical protein